MPRRKCLTCCQLRNPPLPPTRLDRTGGALYNPAASEGAAFRAISLLALCCDSDAAPSATDGRARRCKDAVLLRRPGELRGRYSRAICALRAAETPCAEAEFQIGHCRMGDERTDETRFIGRLPTNFKFQISNFKFQPAVFLQLVLFVVLALALASRAAAEVRLPFSSGVEPIAVNAQWGNRWQAGIYEVWVLGGNCEIRQGKSFARGREAVLWIRRTEPTDARPSEVTAYLEGNVEVFCGGPKGRGRLTDQTWCGQFDTRRRGRRASGGNLRKARSSAADLPARHAAEEPGRRKKAARGGCSSRCAKIGTGPRLRRTPGPMVGPAPGAEPVPAPPRTAPPVMGSPGLGARPMRRRRARPAVAAFCPARPTVAALCRAQPRPVVVAPAATRRIRVFARSDVPVQAQWFPDPNSRQWIAVIDSGVNVVVERAARLQDGRCFDRSAGDLDRRGPGARPQRAGRSKTRPRPWSSTWRGTSSSARATG